MSDKIFVGICNTQPSVPSDFFWSFIGIKTEWEVKPFRSTHPWDVVRNNVIIQEFLNSDCTILAKMDIDQKYPSDYFTKLVPLVDKYKVVGPLIYDRWRQNKFMPLAFSEFENADTGVRLKPVDIEGKDGVIEVPYSHTNLLYSREVLEKIDRPWYEAYLSYDGLSRQNHVDYSFTNKIRKAGYNIMINVDCIVGHEHRSYVGMDFV
jgi:hypothetical protein